MGVKESAATTDVAEIELRVRDRECFFVRASAQAECSVLLEELIHRADGRLIEFFTVRDASPDRIASLAADEPALSEVRLVEEGPAESLFQFVVEGPCVTATLAENGAIPRAVSAVSGEGHVVADVPPHVDVRTVVESFQENHPDSELLGRHDRPRSTPVRSERGVRATLGDRLTEKQLEVLETAYLSGYFDWPRESSAEECADALGIAQPTFSQHVRAAQHNVFDLLFDDDRPA